MNTIYTPQTKEKLESKFGKWHVSIVGDMEYDNGRYYIYNNQLADDNWIAHMFEKGWIDWNEFIPAYYQALKNFGVKNLKTRVFY